jgi:hypothetical protein
MGPFRTCTVECFNISDSKFQKKGSDSEVLVPINEAKKFHIQKSF